MSLIPRCFIESVVAIGMDSIINGSVQKIWIGTGFLVSMKEPNNIGMSTVYLVTNKHVFRNKNTVYIRFNSVVGMMPRDYTLPLVDRFGNKLYTEHLKEDVDIIAMQLNPNQLISDGAKWSAIDLDSSALDLKMMEATGVDEGCLIYALGFPMNLVDNYKSPICRLGCISRVSDAFIQPKSVVSYLVDAQTFPGNSGGPIISRPEDIALTETPNNPSANLIGILSANISYKDVLISQQTQEIRMVQTENSGLTIVHPVDRIKEVVLLEWDRCRVHTVHINNASLYNENNIPINDEDRESNADDADENILSSQEEKSEAEKADNS